MVEKLLLNRLIEVEFHDGEGAEPIPDRDGVLTRFDLMAALMREVPWESEEAEAIDLMNKVVFFEGSVEVEGHWMQRPCVDQDDGIFYWEVNEFTANPDLAVAAYTLFHDCWHVRQYETTGEIAVELDERVEREVDAIERQLLAGAKLGVPEASLEWLRQWNTREHILQRLSTDG